MNTLTTSAANDKLDNSWMFTDEPEGISLEAWMDKLGNRLIAHYGEDFRIMLNEARAKRGLSPLV